jgi:myo-inositol 2-dehydrogenase / D-chiro-inositol 1-dehydrogenase
VTGTPFDTVVIGCGELGVDHHLPALARHDGFRVVAVADPEGGRAEDAAGRFGVREWSLDPAEVIASKPAVAVLATQPDVTPDLAVQALEAGVNVLTDGPPAVTADAAERVLRAADRSNALLQAGLRERFSPLVRMLREWVRAGRLGGPLVVRISRFGQPYAPADRDGMERIRRLIELGPPVVHDGAHAADLLCWLLGRATWVSAGAHRNRPGFPTPNYHSATIGYRDGSLAKLEVGWWFPHLWPGELELYGPDGAAELSRTEGRLRFHDGSHEVVVRMEGDWDAICCDGQLDAFADAIRDGADKRGPDATASRDALELCLAIVAAAESGEAVRL